MRLGEGVGMLGVDNGGVKERKEEEVNNRG